MGRKKLRRQASRKKGKEKAKNDKVVDKKVETGRGKEDEIQLS